MLPMVNAAGPPTRFALKARPIFIGLLVCQCLLIIGRFVIIDLWGAMLTLLVTIMGTFVISPSGGGMDMTYCLYYGLMCLVNGIFDVILCVERMVHVKYAFFHHSAPFMFNVASVVFLCCPIVELSSAMLSGYLYMDAQEAETAALLPHYAAQQAEIAAAREQLDASARGGAWNPQGYKPFEGRACHL